MKCSEAGPRLLQRRGADSWPSSTTRTPGGSGRRPRGSTRPSSGRVTGSSSTGSGLPGHVPLLLFAGRIQPLKGADVAVRTLAALESFPDAHLVVVGGPSGPRGNEHLAHVEEIIERQGVADRVHLRRPPTPRVAVDLLPGGRRLCRTEPLRILRARGLEAAAGGTPAVAAAVGGLTTLVDDGHTGYLVEEADTGSIRRRRGQGARVSGPRGAAGHRRGGAGPALHLE